MTFKEKEQKGADRILMIFSASACVRRHLYAVTDGACCIFLEKEVLGIKEDKELFITWKNGCYRIGSEELSDKRPFYYDTEQKEKLLFLLSKEQEITEESHKILLKKEEGIMIGNAFRNAVFYECFSFVDEQMAEILWENEGYVIYAKGKEGIYINERALHGKSKVEVGDRIDIYGLHILVLRELLVCCMWAGVGRIAEGNSDPGRQTLQLKSRFPRENRNRDVEWIERYGGQEEALHEGKVEIVLPEPLQKERSSPLFLSLGPSVTMVLPMLLMAWLGSRTQQAGSNFYFLSVVMSVCSAFLAFFWGVVNHWYRKYMKRMEEKDRNLQYKEYLEKMKIHLMKCATDNRRILTQKYPPVTAFVRGEEAGARVLWNRYYRQQDFLFLRIGVGMMSFQMQVKTTGEQKKICSDRLTDQAKDLVREFQMLKDVPVGIVLDQIKQIGMIGTVGTDKFAGRIRQLLVQLAACECYTEVKLVCFYRKERDTHRELAEAVRWMRHNWSSDGKTRYLAGDEEEAAQIIPSLTRELERRFEEKEKKLPWYVILLLNEELIRGEVLHQYLLDPDGRYPVSTIFVKETREELPKCCRYYLKDQELISYGEKQLTRQHVFFEYVTKQETEQYFREIYRFQVKESDVQTQLPEKVSFLQMYDCNRVEDLSCAARWKKSNPRQRLKVPIGAGAGGDPIWLDVHEKFHGPHGLIAGTTGSGKSELLQTYLLSLAIQFSPEDVTFFMIDYKGGGTGSMLQGLPHCAGVISNLSGKQIKRAMSAIISENKRRQQLLSSLGVNHIDAYTALYREGKAKKPMPHLLLVVDEFAELKREEPEFMQDIVSLAQVGRSLGIHLILATQKPAGTVDDRIWSNARFRLCLRVQDTQDSMDMLHNKDAARLTTPGQCYLQIGNHEHYELFQAGYCGAYYREEQEENKRTALVERTGYRCYQTEGKTDTECHTQLEVIVRYVNQMAERENYLRADELWMPELSDHIYLEEVEKPLDKEEIRIVLGMCDDPENQRQFPLQYCPKEQGHLAVCAGPMTGKTTMLQTILWQLYTKYQPKQIMAAVIDMGQGSMKCFESMPGCLGILRNEKEKDIFFYHMKKLVSDRKELLGGINIEQYNRAKENPLPLIFLVIDHFGAFFKLLNDSQQEFLIRLGAEGIGYGIYFILSAAPGEIPGKLYEKIKTTLALEMSDRFSYGDILRQYYIPVLPKENTKGRGLAKIDGRILEFQAAMRSS